VGDAVSRETSSVIDEVFSPERRPLAQAYVEWLAGAGVERGLIGPRESGRIWPRHVLNSAVLADVIPEGATLADIGSGAGLPGIALAIARPDLTVTLVEPLERRTRFLEEVVESLGLDGVHVVRGRAESQHGRLRFDVVASRAVAPMDRLLGWCMPLVSAHGVMLALKGSSTASEIEAARPALKKLRCAEPEILVLGESLAALDPEFSPATAVRVAHRDPARVTFP
jgi:16S rRNA (guanine527-N7)-methyltransferase